MRRAASAAIAALATVAGVLVAAQSASAMTPDHFAKYTPSWDAAASQLGTAGSLWEPRFTGGLARTRRVSVTANGLTISPAGVPSGDTFAGTRYGTRDVGLVIMEKWASTGWAAEPAYSTSMAKVGTVRLPIGLPGLRIMVRATVYANCIKQPADADPKPIPKKARCSQASVARTGGVLMMTARPASTMTAPGDTSVVIQSTGVSYKRLLRIARSVEQVAGSAALGAGSAQMLGMCDLMVTSAMTFEQAEAYVQGLGYSARIGSIDGQPQPVTMDYRPDRFTLAMVAGAVTSCTYG